jgi:hypothetical protein
MCVIAEDIINYRNKRAFTFTCNVNSYNDSLHTVGYTASDDMKYAVCSQLDNTEMDLEMPNLLV